MRVVFEVDFEDDDLEEDDLMEDPFDNLNLHNLKSQKLDQFKSVKTNLEDHNWDLNLNITQA